MKKFRVEYNRQGWFRIVLMLVIGKIGKKEIAGEWQSYQGVAILLDEGQTYIAVGDYHRSGDPSTNSFKCNVVYRLEGQVMV